MGHPEVRALLALSTAPGATRIATLLSVGLRKARRRRPQPPHRGGLPSDSRRSLPMARGLLESARMRRYFLFVVALWGLGFGDGCGSTSGGSDGGTSGGAGGATAGHDGGTAGSSGGGTGGSSTGGSGGHAVGTGGQGEGGRGTGGSGGQAGAGSGGGSGAGGAGRVCGPDASCTTCSGGACCGAGCCASGEWCDTSGTTPVCRCGSGSTCTGGNMCAAPVSGTGICGAACCMGSGCPISRRVFKRDIRPVDDGGLQRLYDDLQKIELTTYQYKTEPPSSPRRLGFIIDDTKTSYPINPEGNSVDLYGYMSMAVAAIQVQSREIEALKAEVSRLRSHSPRR